MRSCHQMASPSNVNYFDTLVLAGGSAKGIATLGALQYTQDCYLLRKLKTFIGTSSGAMICYLLVIGYSPVEILTYICTHHIFERMQNFNIVGMLNGNGASSFTNIQEQLEKMTLNKIGFLPTLMELHEKFEKTLVCVTHNASTKKTEYLSHETHPHLPCLTALRMSANLPLIFEEFRYCGSVYLDGGVSDNFAIDVGDRMGQNVLGVILTQEDNKSDELAETNMIEYIYRLMFIPITQHIEHKISQASERCRVARIEYDRFKFFNFNISATDKLEMFSSGYQQMREKFEEETEISV